MIGIKINKPTTFEPLFLSAKIKKAIDISNASTKKQNFNYTT